LLKTENSEHLQEVYLALLKLVEGGTYFPTFYQHGMAKNVAKGQ